MPSIGSPSRILVTGLLTLGLAMAPVVTLPGPKAHAVAPQVRAVPLTGVDQAAQAALVPGEAATHAASTDQPGSDQPQGPTSTVALTPRQDAEPFDLVAVTWDDPNRLSDTTSASVRVRERGTWTQWYSLTEDSSDGPDLTSAEGRKSRGGSAPLLTTGADAYQVKVDTTDGALPAGLQVDLIDAGRSAADGAVAARPAATADAAATKPTIISRAEWGADESLRGDAPTYSNELRVGVVHHTESTNSYSAGEAAAQVRAIYAFHTQTRGWSDIGYNFLVDRYGRVYEGRYGGVDRPVVGAHAGGYNSNTFGVSVLGSYMSVEPPKAVMAGLTSIMAWKMATNAIDPYGASPLSSAGGGTARYPAGDTRLFGNLLGHRDTGSTDCPGTVLYARLDHLRASLRAKLVATDNPGGAAVSNRLASGAKLTEAGYLRSNNGQHILTANGFAGEEFGLVLTGTSCYQSVLNVVGRPAPGGQRANELVMQTDGNLVLYTNGVATWHTGTQGNPGAWAALQDDRNLVVYSKAGAPLFWTGNSCSQMRVGSTDAAFLRAGQTLRSPDLRLRLVMQGDGNLVLYGPSGVRWHTGTFGRPGAFLAVQNDGNLVIYSAAGQPLWASGTSHGALYSDLVLQSDGNLVLYTARPGYAAAWASGTRG